MTTAMLARKKVRVDLSHLDSDQKLELGRRVLSFLDSGATAMNRATHYNSRKEQEAAVEAVHRELANFDRGVYSLMLCLPTTDYSAQIGLGFLLNNSPDGTGILTPEQEAKVVKYVAGRMARNAPHRMLNAFGEYKEQRINNARTRKLILRTLLNSHRLELWSLKYRRKMRDAITHALGRRRASIVRSIMSKERRLSKENLILDDFLIRHLDDKSRGLKTLECVAFILGANRPWTLPLFSAFEASKTDLEAGEKLPPEILEGIRSRFFPDIPHGTVLEITKKEGMTSRQKMQVQASAERTNVEVEFDPTTINDPVALYIYAYERGMTDAIRLRLLDLADKAARSLLVDFESVVVVLDASASMFGDKTQKLRPIASACAIRDVLCAKAKSADTFVSGGYAKDGLIRPSGETDLATTLVKALKADPDAVFIVTDGYENAPAGRVAEVLSAVRAMGISTPVYQLNPVFAAESRAVRSLSNDIPSLPLNDPKHLPISMVRLALSANVEQGIIGLARMALPSVGLQLAEGAD